MLKKINRLTQQLAALMEWEEGGQPQRVTRHQQRRPRLREHNALPPHPYQRPPPFQRRPSFGHARQPLRQRPLRHENEMAAGNITIKHAHTHTHTHI